MNSKHIFVVSSYFIAMAIPLLMVYGLMPTTEEGFIAQIGMLMGLSGIMMVFFQFIISARIKWLDRLFAYNNLIDFHRRMGVWAFIFIVVHFMVLTLSEQSFDMLLGYDEPWYINLGKITFLILLVQVLVSIGHKKISVGYERWRTMHNVFAISILILMFVHSFYAGNDLELLPLQVLWFILPPAAITFFIWQRFFLFTFAPKYKVLNVVKKANDTYSIQFAPIHGNEPFAHNPGQFHFIKFTDCKHLKPEEHPFTISSSPTQKSHLASTIKASGDFTSQIHQIQEGDRVKIIGPFGKMSHVEKSYSGALVFIAGGIGITPFASMLQYMADKDDQREVMLFYFNATESDIAFREELNHISENTSLKLKVVHILSRQDNWEGEKGRFDTELLKKYCSGTLSENDYYVCGPPLMINAVIKDLRKLQVPLTKIHSEMFGFAASGSPATHHKKQAQLVSRLIVLALMVLVILLAGLRSDWKLFGNDAQKNMHSVSRSFSLGQELGLIKMGLQIEKK
ncbi:ferredoxin reductase family protein [Mariniflexile sp.]|uniref:ferredoxin reductase family protein n=1 Tax=Mariniflexile sp. TaxID=1979402 RepID=UPI00404763C7